MLEVEGQQMGRRERAARVGMRQDGVSRARNAPISTCQIDERDCDGLYRLSSYICRASNTPFMAMADVASGASVGDVGGWDVESMTKAPESRLTKSSPDSFTFQLDLNTTNGCLCR